MKTYDNFFLPVEDMAQAKAFYGEVLGLKTKFEFPDSGMAAYRVGQEEPAIILKDRKKFPDAKPTIWFEVDRQLREKGLVFLSEPFRIRTGWAAEFEDPFGNRLGITDYLT